eukprot:GFUD01111353.1.p1 GENE.GFUD01111353.1~~GFUD01111353.1.p1  ORF type:complete len:124 (+),score=40.29 GFUD01111353.1:105-476(+)
MDTAGEEIVAGGDKNAKRKQLLDLNEDEKVEHLETMTQYKSYAKIGLLSFSILLQVIATCLLFVERIAFNKQAYSKSHKYDIAIGVLVIVIIVVNIFTSAFGLTADCCATPLDTVSMEEGSGH